MRFVLAGALAISFTLPLASTARADHWNDDCHKRLENDKARIDHDAAKYGDHSRKVDNDVAKLDNDRNWCRGHHADWDHSMFDVGIYVRH
jgi:hypothetical protein